MTTQLATDMASSSSAAAWVTASPWRNQCRRVHGVGQRQFRSSTSNMSNMPVFWACKEAHGAQAPWA